MPQDGENDDWIENQEDAKRLFENVINHVKVGKIEYIQTLLDEVEAKYGYDPFSICTALDWHITQGNMSLTCNFGKPAIFRRLLGGPAQDWKWNVRWNLVPYEKKY